MEVPFLEVLSINKEFENSLLKDFKRVFSSGRYILDKEVENFEKNFSNYCGTKYCIGVANGLEALHLILLALGIGGEDEVIVPSNTYIATGSTSGNLTKSNDGGKTNLDIFSSCNKTDRPI